MAGSATNKLSRSSGLGRSRLVTARRLAAGVRRIFRLIPGMALAACLLLRPELSPAADELTLIRAALEDRRSTIRSLHVKYRFKQTLGPGAAEMAARGVPSETSGEGEWAWTPKRQMHREQIHPAGETPSTTWAWDGVRFTEVHIPSDGSRPGEGFESNSPPSPDHEFFTPRSMLIGLTGRLELDIAELLSTSPAARVETDDDARENAVIFRLSPAGPPGDPFEITAAFDAGNAWMPLRIRMQRLASGKPDGPPEEIEILESRVVAAAEGDESAVFPVTVRYVSFENDGQVRSTHEYWFDEIRLNSELPVSMFSREFPVGMLVRATSSRGKPQRTYVAGGPEAEAAYYAELAESAVAERKRLEAEGVVLDAGSPREGGLLHTMSYVAAGGCLMALGLVYWRRRT